MSYTFLEHTADVKFRATGTTLEEVFTDSAMALKEIVCGNIEISDAVEKEVVVEGKDLEGLLYDFLEEFLVLLDSEDFLLNKIKEIKIDENEFKLRAVVSGDKAEKYKFTNDVKAVTYNDIFVRTEGDKFVAQVVLDV